MPRVLRGSVPLDVIFHHSEDSATRDKTLFVMSQGNSPVEMSAIELVDAAIEDRTRFKKIAAELESMQPDEHAARNLISAFRSRRCEPWLTAHLLGCIGHRLGYETAKIILLSNAGSSSESYAGVAMAKMLGIAAYDDLRQIFFGDHPQKIRQGAAHGMAATSSPRLLDDFFTAFVEQRISRKAVSWYIAECSPSDDWLLGLTRSDSTALKKLACAIVELMASPISTHRSPGHDVAHSIQNLLSDETFSINPRRRENLLAWINSVETTDS